VRQLEHPGIIKYHEVFESGQKIYLVMALGGRSLDAIAESESERLSPSFVRSVLRQLLQVLSYLQEQCVSHHGNLTS